MKELGDEIIVTVTSLSVVTVTEILILLGHLLPVPPPDPPPHVETQVISLI